LWSKVLSCCCCCCCVRKSILPVKLSDRCWCGCLSGVRCRLFAYGPADAAAIPKPHHLLPHLNPDWFYLSGTGLPRLSCKQTHTHTHTFNCPSSGTTRVSRYYKVKPFWILLKQETVSGSGISWTIICKSAPRSRQITTPAPHHSVFYRPDALPDAQPAASKH